MKEVIKILNEIKSLQSLQKDVFNMNDFCVYTGFSKEYAYHLTSSRKIDFYRPCGKIIFFRAEDVKEFLLQNPVESKSNIDQKTTEYLTK